MAQCRSIRPRYGRYRCRRSGSRCRPTGRARTPGCGRASPCISRRCSGCCWRASSRAGRPRRLTSRPPATRRSAGWGRASRWPTSCARSGWGQMTLWQGVLAAARNDAQAREAALSVVGDVMQLIEVGSTVAAEAYLEAQQRQIADSDRVRRDLLEDLLARRDLSAGPKQTLLRVAGLEPGTTLLVHSAAPVTPVAGEHVLSAAAGRDPRGAVAGTEGLALARQDEIVGVMPVPARGPATTVANLRRAVADLQRRQVPLAVGISTVHSGLNEVPEAYAEACVARDGLGERPEVIALPTLSSFDYLVLREDETARRMVRPRLRRFIEEDAARGGALITTLTEYIACDRNAKTAARRLHIHVNTAYYRLERIAERTGCDLRSFTAAGLTANWAADVRRRLCRVALGQDLPTLETTPVGELLDRIDGDVYQVASELRGSGVRIVQTLAVGVLSVVTVLVVWWPAGLAMLVLATLLAARLSGPARRISPARMGEEEAWSDLAAVMEESIHGQDDVRTSLARPYVLRLYARRASRVLARGRVVWAMSARVTTIASGVIHAGIAAVVVGGVWAVAVGRIDGARLTAVWLLALAFGGTVEQVSRMVPELQYALGAWSRVQLLRAARQEPSGGAAPTDGDLAVRGLSFSYRADGPGPGSRRWPRC